MQPALCHPGYTTAHLRRPPYRRRRLRCRRSSQCQGLPARNLQRLRRRSSHRALRRWRSTRAGLHPGSTRARLHPSALAPLLCPVAAAPPTGAPIRSGLRMCAWSGASAREASARQARAQAWGRRLPQKEYSTGGYPSPQPLSAASQPHRLGRLATDKHAFPTAARRGARLTPPPPASVPPRCTWRAGMRRRWRARCWSATAATTSPAAPTPRAPSRSRRRWCKRWRRRRVCSPRCATPTSWPSVRGGRLFGVCVCT